MLTGILFLSGCEVSRQHKSSDNSADSTTIVRIKIPDQPIPVDPRIYGQMLEYCNDRIIYDGIVNKDGSKRPNIDQLLRPLQIPVVRWPAGTYSFYYDWRNGVGPVDKRPVTEIKPWGGTNNNRFGTDEFLSWCATIGTAPYINFNMGNRPGSVGTLDEALNWIEYVNGSEKTTYGKMRTDNGHRDPYHVKYWGIGNENYGPWGEHDKESDTVYSQLLYDWARTIHERYPDLSLMGVGHTYNWDKTVLEKAGHLIDFLTQHYYVTSKFRDSKIEDPEGSLFAPVKVEEHLKKLALLVNEINQQTGRAGNPIRLCIDEWNNRHSVYHDGKFGFTRQDPRRQSDVAIVAGLLNVFIRQSPVVGMANYIFPVNAHGLIRSVGDSDAYLASIYHVFLQYRLWMTGKKADAEVRGPGLTGKDLKINLDGDAGEVSIGSGPWSFIDAAAVISDDGTMNISLVNRSHNRPRKIRLILPEGYIARKKWILSNPDINAANTPESRNEIAPEITLIKNGEKELSVVIDPCGVNLIQCVKGNR